MTALKESHVMNGPRCLIVGSVVAAAIAMFGSACYPEDACGKGLIEVPGTNNCMAAPPPPVDAGDFDAGSFGKACGSPAECGPEAPLCNPALPYCTQSDCKDGEAHAGACPPNFTCAKIGDYPSFCQKN